jgi:hypothetical protein
MNQLGNERAVSREMTQMFLFETSLVETKQSPIVGNKNISNSLPLRFGPG